MSAFNRRHILLCLGATGLAACGPRVARFEPDDPVLAERITAAAEAARRYFDDAEGVFGVGVVVLEQLPELDDASVEAVLDRALRTIEAAGSDVVADLEAQVQADFDTLDVTDVGGWTLSPTEAGLAALITLDS
ncbi:MAG: hypothetical protein AAF211_00120 [Myxococcota bacterium]